MYEFELMYGDLCESILFLENNIDDVCWEMKLFGVENEFFLEEIMGFSLWDYIIN